MTEVQGWFVIVELGVVALVYLLRLIRGTS